MTLNYPFLKAMRPQKIDVIADYIYVTLYNHTIYKLNKNGQEEGSILLQGQHIATDIVVLHPLKQDMNSELAIAQFIHVYRNIYTIFVCFVFLFLVTNPCSNNSCANEAACILSSTDSRGWTCKCPDHLVETIVQNVSIHITPLKSYKKNAYIFIYRKPHVNHFSLVKYVH